MNLGESLSQVREDLNAKQRVWALGFTEQSVRSH